MNYDTVAFQWTRAHGAWLDRRLRDLGFDQTMLADHLNVSRITVNRWTTGRTNPLTGRKPQVIGRLAKLLQFSSVKEMFDAADRLIGRGSITLSREAHETLARVTARGALDLTEIPPSFDHSFRSGLAECTRSGILVLLRVAMRRVVYEPRFAILALLAREPLSSSSLVARLQMSEDAVRAASSELQDSIVLLKTKWALRKRDYKLVIFDWSNTLVDETDFDNNLCEYLAGPQRDTLREHLDRLQAERDYRWYDYKYLAELCGKRWKDVISYHEHQQHAFRLKWIGDARFLLNFCTRTWQCALATNCVRHVLDLRMRIAGVDAASFARIVTSDDTKDVRTKHEHYRTILKSLNVAASNALVISDNLECDVLPAVQMGMDAIWFYYKTPFSFWGSPSPPLYPDDARMIPVSLKPTFIALEHIETLGWLAAAEPTRSAAQSTGD